MNTSVSLNMIQYPGLFTQNVFKKPSVLHFSSCQNVNCNAVQPGSKDIYVHNTNNTTLNPDLAKKEKSLAKIKDSFSYTVGIGFFLFAAGIAMGADGAAVSMLPATMGLAGAVALVGAAALYFIGNNMQKDIDKIKKNA